MTEISILVLGDSQVGKSQLLYGEPGLIQANNATFRTKKMYLFAEDILFRLLSLSGKWEAEQIPPAFLQKKYDMVYVMFDLTNRASFERVASYIRAIKRVNKKANILMVATKYDDLEHRVVTNAEIKRATKKFNCECIQTSAVNKKNLHEMFVKTREIVFERRAREETQRELGFLRRLFRRIVLFVVTVSLRVKGFIQRNRKKNAADAPIATPSSTGQIAKTAGFVPAGQPDEKVPRVEERVVEEVNVKDASPSLRDAFAALNRMK